MKKFLLLTAIACTATVSAVAPAMAGDITVSGTVNKSCTQPAATSASIAGYDGTADVSVSSPIKFRCTKNTVGTVSIPATGTLTGVGTVDTLTYKTTANGLTATGTGLSGGATPTNVLTVANTVTVEKDQDVEPAAYSGTVAVSISF
jgi:hypothetical protein